MVASAGLVVVSSQFFPRREDKQSAEVGHEVLGGVLLLVHHGAVPDVGSHPGGEAQKDQVELHLRAGDVVGSGL